MVVADPRLVAGHRAGRLDPAHQPGVGQRAAASRRRPGGTPRRGRSRTAPMIESVSACGWAWTAASTATRGRVTRSAAPRSRRSYSGGVGTLPYSSPFSGMVQEPVWAPVAARQTTWSSSASSSASSAAVSAGSRDHLNWNSTSSSSSSRSCSMENCARTGTLIRSPATWVRNGFPVSSASASRRSFATRSGVGWSLHVARSLGHALASFVRGRSLQGHCRLAGDSPGHPRRVNRR